MSNNKPDSLLTRLVVEAALLNDSESKDEESWFRIKTSKGEYSFDPKSISGDISQVFFGHQRDQSQLEVVLKLVDQASDNDLMQNEIKSLSRLWTQTEVAQQKHLPRLIDQFKTEDGRVGIILSRFDGYSLREVRENPLYYAGVPIEHVVWMFCRLLSVIGFAHSKAIIHGNIEPSNILISPRDHNLCLIDWTSTIIDPSINPKGFQIFNPEFSAPEVQEKKTPTPASDLYSAAKCMVYLLGGDIQKNIIPDSIDPRISSFINFFLLPSQLQRAQDAWAMSIQLQNLRKEIWGEHSFIEFDW